MLTTRHCTGAYVIDTSTGRIGQVMDNHGSYTQVRPPHGGLERDCPPEALRVATTDELRAVGITAAIDRPAT